MSEIAHTNITRLVVKNYRSLANIDITLSPLTVFVGENGAGKSNVIDTLRFVRDALTNGLDCAVKSRGGINALRCWFVDENKDISIDLYFEGAEWAGEYGFVFGQEGSACQIKAENFSVSNHQRGDPHHKRLFFQVKDNQLVNSSEKIELADNARCHFGKKRLYLSQLATVSSCAAAIYKFLANMSFYDLWPDGLRKPQPVLSPFPLLETGQNLASALRELQRRKDDDLITNALEVVTKGISGYFVEEQNEHLITTLHYTYPAPSDTFQNGKLYSIKSDLSHEADGTIRMLGILTALYQERFPSPLAIEEPEKAIYTDALALLCGKFQNFVEFNYQILLTTHRPDLIDDLPVSSLLVVEKENGITKIGPVSSEQQEIIAQELFSLGELIQMEGLFREGAL